VIRLSRVFLRDIERLVPDEGGDRLDAMPASDAAVYPAQCAH